VRRAFLAIAVALLLAAPAAAKLPGLKGGSSVGEAVPLKAYATIRPTVHLFGDSITAKIAVVADTKWVDPQRLRVRVAFAPYEEAKAPSVLRVHIGRFSQVTWTWTLRCITSPCVPRVPPSEKYHVFKFPQARIEYLQLDGTPAYGINASWPPVEVLSQVSPGVTAFLEKTNHVNWRLGISPVAAPTYRVSPGLLYWVAIGVAGLFGLVGLWLAWRWYLAVRPRRSAAIAFEPGTQLERALAVLRYAHRHGDETLQRKAFERVAGELGVARADELTQIARELAWSPRTPEDEEVEEFAEQARETQETVE
jgi:hypothetical protein